MSNIQSHEVTAATERIKLRLRRTAEDIIAIGQDLILIKQSLPHGEFLPWIEREFEMSQPSAKRFMSVASRFTGKSLTMSDLKPTVLYELAAPSTPPEVVEQITEKASQGESVSVAEVKALKDQLKAEQQAKQQALDLAEKLDSESETLSTEIKKLEGHLEKLNKHIDILESRKPDVIEKEVVVEKSVIPERYKSEDDAVKQLQKERKELSDQIHEKQKILKDMSSFVNSAEHQKQIAFDAKTVYARMVNAYRDIAETFERIANNPRVIENQAALDELVKLENFFEDRLDQIAAIKRRARTVDIKAGQPTLMIGAGAVEVSA